MSYATMVSPGSARCTPPALANVAGAVESGIERVVVVSRRNPLLAVGVVAGIGLALTLARPRRPL